MILDLEDAETKQLIWEMPEILLRFGITGRPSTDSTLPPPLGLTAANAHQLRLFLDSLHNRPFAQKRVFADEGDDCSAGRDVWR